MVKSCAKSLHDVVASWWLYMNTAATKANTAATSANTAATSANTAATSANTTATDTNTAMATEAGPTTAGGVSSMIQRAWDFVKKPFACVGSAYAGYLIYVREHMPSTDPI
jgi:hypothetical protein